jgi:hypothetical protein
MVPGHLLEKKSSETVSQSTTGVVVHITTNNPSYKGGIGRKTVRTKSIRPYLKNKARVCLKCEALRSNSSTLPTPKPTHPWVDSCIKDSNHAIPSIPFPSSK